MFDIPFSEAVTTLLPCPTMFPQTDVLIEKEHVLSLAIIFVQVVDVEVVELGHTPQLVALML